ncbi:MAG: aspartate aminotransferase family protein [Proteobacteria bacterium]|nr:aspartate aminotransferase family protein [Pseudomonadota bacterium]
MPNDRFALTNFRRFIITPSTDRQRERNVMRMLMPDHGMAAEDVLTTLAALKQKDCDWKNGRAPAYAFNPVDEIYELGRSAFLEYFSENALGMHRAFPSVKQLETEVIDMALGLFNGPPGATGFMTTGGTESIIQAVQACRDLFRATRPSSGNRNNIVAPDSVHPAFEKAGRLMDIQVRRVSVGTDFRADPAAIRAAIDEDTIMVVGSAPCFPYGTIDPISEIAAIARERGVWMHVDACVGGYIAPFARMIGRPIPAFDFAIEGVCSLSADLHKFGLCPKPASTVFYRTADHARFHPFEFSGWPSGRFYTTTIVGTRPAGGVAAAWAVFRHLGIAGYKRIAEDLLAHVDAYRAGIAAIPGLKVLGDPHLSIVAFGSDEIDVFRVAEVMAEKGWLPGLLQRPKAIHRMLSRLHMPVMDEYLSDLRAAVQRVRESTPAASRLEAIY